uniref:Transmembrane protein n=1 Tax=Guillardia theta TaxID=55529 RepID=A0A7S4KLJ8_GUITH|mmetsp:Transcript_26900/g.87990  ORF Transcript_26900/g.87990 Transcript_26900/m.87990 type:complete len:465 (+) Transcript_26900:152-1546(+)
MMNRMMKATTTQSMERVYRFLLPSLLIVMFCCSVTGLDGSLHAHRLRRLNSLPPTPLVRSIDLLSSPVLPLPRNLCLRGGVAASNKSKAEGPAQTRKRRASGEPSAAEEATSFSQRLLKRARSASESVTSLVSHGRSLLYERSTQISQPLRKGFQHLNGLPAELYELISSRVPHKFLLPLTVAFFASFFIVLARVAQVYGLMKKISVFAEELMKMSTPQSLYKLLKYVQRLAVSFLRFLSTSVRNPALLLKRIDAMLHKLQDAVWRIILELYDSGNLLIAKFVSFLVAFRDLMVSYPRHLGLFAYSTTMAMITAQGRWKTVQMISYMLEQYFPSLLSWPAAKDLMVRMQWWSWCAQRWLLGGRNSLRPDRLYSELLAQNLVKAAAMPMQLVNAAILYLRREVPRASRSLPSPMLLKSYRKAQKMSGIPKKLFAPYLTAGLLYVSLMAYVSNVPSVMEPLKNLFS